MKSYLTYEEYVVYYGGICDETTFTRNIDRACGIIDDETNGRVAKMSAMPRQVGALCRDLVEYLAKTDAPEPTVSSKSQTAGTVSQSVTYTVKTTDEQKKEIGNLIRDYLSAVYDDNGTPLLYRGCRY